MKAPILFPSLGQDRIFGAHGVCSIEPVNQLNPYGNLIPEMPPAFPPIGSSTGLTCPTNHYFEQQCESGKGGRT